MTRPSKLCRFIRIAGIVGLIVLVPSWALSTQSCYILAGGDWIASLWGGVLSFQKGPMVQSMLHRPTPPQSPFNLGPFNLAKLFKPKPLPPPTSGLAWRVFHVSLYSSRYGMRFQLEPPLTDIRVPLWLPAALSLAAIAAATVLGRPRHRAGHCRQCGYNLAGNLSGRCPECGTEIAIAIAANPGKTMEPLVEEPRKDSRGPWLVAEAREHTRTIDRR